MKLRVLQHPPQDQYFLKTSTKNVDGKPYLVEGKLLSSALCIKYKKNIVAHYIEELIPPLVANRSQLTPYSIDTHFNASTLDGF